MRCVVTAGPTYEPLDEVRRLTNFSTGRLGIELGNHLEAQGHEVTLLVGEQATWPGKRQVQHVEVFTTTADLSTRLAGWSGRRVQAVFHAAAVSDFAFGQIWSRSSTGELVEVHAGKISSRESTLLAELRPTPKIIARLRGWFPRALIAGWKYEVDGDRRSVIAKARQQIRANRMDACVANGPAYGSGFGLVIPEGPATHLADRAGLLAALSRWLEKEEFDVSPIPSLS